MLKTMKGYAMLRIGETGWIEKNIPAFGPSDTLLRPLVVAPCTTDIKTVWKGALGERHNMILGHEAVAEVVETGPLVKDFKPGDRVVVPAVTPNWSAVESQAGFSSHSGGFANGWRYSNYEDGMFSEYFTVNDADGNLAHVPTGVDLEDAVMLSDMLPPGFAAAEFADVQFGDTVLVVGVGPVGLMAVAACGLRGAARIIAVGSRPNCLQLAKQYGATDVVDYKNGDIYEQIMDLTGGKGVDRVCICGGTPEVFSPALKCTRPGGKVGSVIAMALEDKISFPSLDFGLGIGNKSISAGMMTGGRHRMEKLGALLASKRVDAKPLITHRFMGWDQLPTAIFLAKDKPTDFIKTVVDLS